MWKGFALLGIAAAALVIAMLVFLPSDDSGRVGPPHALDLAE